MSIDTIIAGNHIRVSDRLFGAELWRPTDRPPYSSGSLAMWEGGTVSSSTGTTVSLSAARQAINPDTRENSYATSLSAVHTGRQLLIWHGSGSGDSYEITSHTGNTITCAEADFHLVAGDQVVICDRLKPTDVSAEQNIDNTMGSFSMGSPNDTALDDFGTMQAMSWAIWQKRLVGDTDDSGWFTRGVFCMNGAADDIEPSDWSINAQGLDALKLAGVESLTGSWSADKIPVHQRVQTGSSACVVLKQADHSYGTSGSEGYFSFYDSPESTEAGIETNHTRYWTDLPSPILYRSANQLPLITGTDEPLSASDTLEVLFGSGEVRVQANYLHTEFTGSDGAPQPYVKARYVREASTGDVVRGIVTGLSGTRLTDSNVVGTALEFVDDGLGLRDMHVFITSGTARGQRFRVSSNTSGSLTLDSDTSLAGLGVQVGDTYELGDINDPRRIIETGLLRSGYQMTDRRLPLYIAEFDDVLIEDRPAAVVYDPASGSNVDFTEAAKDESLQSIFSGSSGDALYVGHDNPFTRVMLDFSGTWASGAAAVEYWNGSTWGAVPSHGYEDGTNGFQQTGRLSWNMPNNWRVSGTDSRFYSRVRVTSAANPIALNRVSVSDRVSVPSPLEYKPEDATTALEVYDYIRKQSLIAPNWILWADPSGTIRGSEVRQNATADWIFSRQEALRREQDDDNFYTGVLYRGYSEGQTNIAVSTSGTSVAECSELTAALATGDVEELPGYADYTAGLPGVIDGIDLRDRVRISGGIYDQRWQYRSKHIDSTTSQYLHSLNDLPLWYVDLSEQKENISEVRVVIDGYVDAHEVTRGERGRPVFALDVSSDEGPYSSLTWRPLSQDSQSVEIDNTGIREYRYSNSDSGWQSDWRYIRMRCLKGGKVYSKHGRPVTQTGAVIELKVFQDEEISAIVYVGENAPFTSATYVNMLRRYGHRLYVVGEVDYSANTIDKVTERAVAILREQTFEMPELTVAGIRPDAQLFQTVQLTQDGFGYSSRNFLLTSLSLGLGVDTSMVVRDYTVKDD